MGGARVVLGAWCRGLRPRFSGGVVSWAEAHRVLDGDGGLYRVSRVPYWREVMDCLSEGSGVRRIVVMKAAQLGATEVGVNWLGYVMNCAPGNFLWLCGTREQTKRMYVQRVMPLLRAFRDGGETYGAGADSLQVTNFPGGQLLMGWAAATQNIRGMSVRYVFMDEVDSYRVDGPESPVDLAEARLSAAGGRGKVLLVSTPTECGLSRIEREYEATDRREYHVPCPWCRELQPLWWRNLKWDWGSPGTVEYLCSACGRGIPEGRKVWMLDEENGCCWRPMADEGRVRDAVSAGVRGYHLNGLYSPPGWLSWVELVRRYEAASEAAESLRVFWNTVLGLPYTESDALSSVPADADRSGFVRYGRLRVEGIDGLAGAVRYLPDHVLWRFEPFEAGGLVDAAEGLGLPDGFMDRLARKAGVVA